MNICKTVALRTRPIKNGMLSFYLDYYPGYRDPDTMKVVRHESLGIYIHAHPRTTHEKQLNRSLTEKAKLICGRRYEQVVCDRYDLPNPTRRKGDFLSYYESLLRKHDKKWDFVYQHFCNYVQGKCTFEEIDLDLCNGFREYLLSAKQLNNAKLDVSRNSAAGYWSTFRGLLKHLYRNKLIASNINDFLDKIETTDVVKDYLSEEELYTLAETECPIPILRTASLFACLTGLRISDILALRWEDIVDYSAGGKCVHIITQKTKSEDIIPISEEALDLIAYAPDKICCPHHSRVSVEEESCYPFAEHREDGLWRVWQLQALAFRHRSPTVEVARPASSRLEHRRAVGRTKKGTCRLHPRLVPL